MRLRTAAGTLGVLIGIAACTVDPAVEAEFRTARPGPASSYHPDGIGPADHLLTVSATGQLVYQGERELCLFTPPDPDPDGCIGLGDTELRAVNEAESVTWSPDGRQLALDAGGQVVVVGLVARQAWHVGGIGEPYRVHSPFWYDGQWVFVETKSDDDFALLLTRDGVFDHAFFYEPGIRQQFPLPMNVGGSVLALSRFGEPNTVVRLDDDLEPLTARPVGFVGDVLAATSRSPTNEAVAVLTFDGDDRTIRWDLLTATETYRLPFTGSSTAPAPDGSGAAGTMADDPTTVVHYDIARGLGPALASFDEPVDDVFWPSIDRLVVRTGTEVHLVQL